MYIAIRRGSSGSWALIGESVPRDGEGAPVIPIGQLTELIPGVQVAIQDFQLEGSRVVDLVGIDARGDIVLAIARYAPTPEIREVCVSRLLELAAHLRRDVPFDEFEQRLLLLHGRPLEEIVHESLPDTDRERFDGRAFRLRLAQNLEQGRFRLVLAVDRIGDDLVAFFDYLRESSEGMIRFEPIEVAHFVWQGYQLMIPRVPPTRRLPVDIDEGGDDLDELDDPWRDAHWRSNVPMPIEEEEFPDFFRALEDELDGDEDPIERIYEYLRREDIPGDSHDVDDADGEADGHAYALSISGRRHDEDRFFAHLTDACSPDAKRRAQRLTRLGREPSRTLPAGWMVSETTLSFQAGFFAGTVEPLVTEIFRLTSTAELVLDLPALRRSLDPDAIDTFVQDLRTNAHLGDVLTQADACCAVHLDQAFRSDHDVRSFCVAVRKLVLGLGIRDDAA